MATHPNEYDALGMALGERIRQMREARGLSREDLAYLAGLTREGLRQIETRGAEPRYWTAWRIAKVLDVKMEALAGEAPKAESVVVEMYPRRHVSEPSTSTSNQSRRQAENGPGKIRSDKGPLIRLAS